MIGYLLAVDSVLVWDSKDVTNLRVNHRIVGSLIGSMPGQPKQNNDFGLPLALMAEETNLLVEQGVLSVRRFDDILNTLSPSEQEQIKLLYEQLVENDRENQFNSFVSKTSSSKETVSLSHPNFSPVVSIHTKYPFMFENHCQQEEGKSVPCLEEGGGDHSTSTVEEKSINSNEDGTVEEKSINSNKDGATPISIVTVEMKQDIEKQANPNGHCWKWPYTDYQALKYKVFKDLWRKGFYITTGLKFGGDYLVYESDPLCVHSSFIAKIINWNEPITMSDLVVAGRLGGKVKKQTLLCSVYPQDDTTVQYLTLNWSGSGTNI